MRRFILFQEEHSRWAVPEEAVSRLDGGSDGVIIRLKSGVDLWSTRVVGRVEGRERALGPVEARFLPRGVGALAVVADMPVAVVDLRDPPERLVAKEGDAPKKGEAP